MTHHITPSMTHHMIHPVTFPSLDAYTQPLYAQFASYSISFPLNPNARTFTPTNTFNGAIGAFFAIILILSGIISYVLYIYKQEVSDDLSSKETLKSLKAKNINKIIFGHLNINSVRNKIDGVRYIIGNNIDIFLISETKLNETFPEGQFLIDGYFPPYRKDRTDKGGGLLLYVRDHISSRLVNTEICSDIEAFVIEINLKKRKWLLFCTYRPQKSMISNHMKILSLQLNVFQKRYENFIILGDFNSEIDEDAMKDFCVIYNFKSLINHPTCFKNPENPSCIDLILTNRPMSFHNTSVIETGLSDFHKLAVTVLKMSFSKQVPKVFYYRDYKTFNDEHFNNDLTYVFNKRGLNNISCSELEDLTIATLNVHAPMKKKYLRANNAPYMNRALCKAIMVRS